MTQWQNGVCFSSPEGEFCLISIRVEVVDHPWRHVCDVVADVACAALMSGGEVVGPSEVVVVVMWMWMWMVVVVVVKKKTVTLCLPVRRRAMAAVVCLLWLWLWLLWWRHQCLDLCQTNHPNPSNNRVDGFQHKIRHSHPFQVPDLPRKHCNKSILRATVCPALQCTPEDVKMLEDYKKKRNELHFKKKYGFCTK